jgi:hypothetical protein
MFNQRQNLSTLKNKFTKSIHVSTYVKQVESGVGSGFGTINPDPGRTWVKFRICFQDITSKNKGEVIEKQKYLPACEATGPDQ